MTALSFIGKQAQEIDDLRAEVDSLKSLSGAVKKNVRHAATSIIEMNAHIAACQGDWPMAKAYWEQALSVDPYLSASESAVTRGDMVEAERIIEEGLSIFEGNPALLEQYCQLAIKEKNWLVACQRWRDAASVGCAFSPRFQAVASEAFIQTRQIGIAQAMLAPLLELMPDDRIVLRAQALLAEACGDWAAAAEAWRKRGDAVKSLKRRHVDHVRAMRALLQIGEEERVEEECRAVLVKYPNNLAYLKLYAELAILDGAWEVALERWRRLEEVDTTQVGGMPPQWIYRIGVEAARARTNAIGVSRLRACGLLNLARTIQSVDEAGALMVARGARRHYPEKVLEMTAAILQANTRHSAAIWWLRRLIAQAKDPRRYYLMLVDSLIESSRLEECEEIIAAYVASYERDTLWLRAMLEIHYRRGDFAAMRDVMEEASVDPLPVSVGRHRVMDWLLKLIRMHPEPASFLPPELHDLVLRTVKLYDSKYLASSVAMLLRPEQGDMAAEGFKAQIREAAQGRSEIDPIPREAMLQFFIQRRDWDQVEALLDLPLSDILDAQNVRKVWNIVRNKMDIELGRGDVARAEQTALDHLGKLEQAGLHDAILSQGVGMLTRVPTSGHIIAHFESAAETLGFRQMAVRAHIWKEKYAGNEYGYLLGSATRRRCFVVGNAPSIAQMPLHLLEGEDIICMNRGMRAMSIGLPLPKCLVVGDPLVYKNHAAELDQDGRSVEHYFIGANCLWRRESPAAAVPLGSSGLKLSLAPFKHVPWNMHRGDTIAILAAGVAHLMGYKEIYIIGVDLDYSGSSTHFYTNPGEGQKEVERLANFRPGGSGTELVNLAFANLQKVIERDGVRMYNAAPAGKLDSIPRVNFSDVVEAPHISVPREAAQ